MNKLEMIAYLQRIYAAVNPVFEPTQKNTSGEIIQTYDGGIWCIIQVREVDATKNTAIYKNVHVYVIDEGLGTEEVFFKDDVAPPEVLPITEEVTPT
jgi:hypothetical protein